MFSWQSKMTDVLCGASDLNDANTLQFVLAHLVNLCVEQSAYGHTVRGWKYFSLFKNGSS